MTILFFVFLGVMAVAVGTTIVAIARAQDGYEDECGFHVTGMAPAPGARNCQNPADLPPTRHGGRTPAPEPAMATARELPSGLIEGRFSP